jgi:hypothetical protein
MTVLADFNTIIGDGAPPGVGVAVGVSKGKPSPLGNRFSAGGRLGEGSGETGDLAAFIMFSVRNLQVRLRVFINGEDIGPMEANPFPGWYSQVICMSGGRLISGDDLNNEVSVGLALETPVQSATFRIKNLICFYHQDSD